MIICEKKYCTGCESCMNACPRECIKFNWREEWLAYPEIDSTKCINCGKCKSVCPIINPKERVNKIEQTVLIGAMKNNEHIKKSSSGGIAYSLGMKILNLGGVVFGAIYDEDMYVRHIEINNIFDLKKTQGSKYVQSDLGNCFNTVRERLKENRKVLFIGLPCQIAALYSFLGNEHDNLFTCDLICGGLTPPKLFRKYLDYLERKKHIKIKDYNFRNKKFGFGYYCSIMTENNKEIFLNGQESLFVSLLGKGYGRESCFSCKFTSFERNGDLTLGDFYRSDVYLCNDGASLVMVNTEKGKSLIDLLKTTCDFETVKDIDKYILNINALNSPKKEPNDYVDFFDDIDILTWEEICSKYILSNMNIKDKVMIHLPLFLKKYISELKRRITKI